MVLRRYVEPRAVAVALIAYHLAIIGTGILSLIQGPPGSLDIVSDESDVVRTLWGALFVTCGLVGLLGRLGWRWLNGAGNYIEAVGIIGGGVATAIWGAAAVWAWTHGHPGSPHIVLRFAATAALSVAAAVTETAYTWQRGRLEHHEVVTKEAIAEAARELSESMKTERETQDG